MLLFLLAQVTPNPSEAPPPPPRSGLVTLFSSDDYPKEAIRHRWEGTVQVEIAVSPEGRVSGCRIVRSSGYAVLDEKTCDIMRTRAKFTPAKDSNGRPVEDHVVSPPIMWRLPR
jgi:protein TonB